MTRRSALACLLSGAARAAEPGFVSLFDGRTLNGWNLINPKGTGYKVENGALVCPADGGGRLFSYKEYSDFILRFEYRMQPGANSGVAIRSPMQGNPTYDSIEIQIRDDPHPRFAKAQMPVRFHGSVYDVIPARPADLNQANIWNSEEIEVSGRHVTVRLNGTAILDADLGSVTDPKVLSRHPGLARASGHIGFLGHAGNKIEFRNIRICDLTINK